MHKIKFKGKRIDNGEWVYGYYWCNEEAGDFYKGKHFIRSMNFQPAEFDYTDYEVIPETVGQLVCLDKNGDEVYAGDKVKSGKRILTIMWYEEELQWHAKEEYEGRISPLCQWAISEQFELLKD